MTDANLVRVLQAQTSAPVALLSADVVRAGVAAVQARVSELAKEGAVHLIADAAADADLEVFHQEVEAARAEAALHGLNEVVRAPWRTHDVTLRWIYTHMIAEYARHNGHADLIRERIDGSTGV